MRSGETNRKENEKNHKAQYQKIGLLKDEMKRKINYNQSNI
jgi:hypothetical protein